MVWIMPLFANNALDKSSTYKIMRFGSSQALPTKADLNHYSLSPRLSQILSIQRDVTHTLSEAATLLRPEAIWKEMNLAGSELARFTNLPSSLLARVERSFGVVCTIGPELEARTRQYLDEHRYTRGYLLDQIGDLAVVMVARRSARFLRGQHDAFRWAPGDFPDDRALKGQEAIFDQVPAEHIGVRLNAHNVMTPAKSLSFMLLAGTENNSSSCLIHCDRCVWNGYCDETDDFSRT